MGFCVLDVVRRLEVVTRLADDDRGFFGGFLRAHLQQSSGLVLVWYRGLFAWVFAWLTLMQKAFGLLLEWSLPYFREAKSIENTLQRIFYLDRFVTDLW
jgi:hypothetical protein